MCMGVGVEGSVRDGWAGCIARSAWLPKLMTQNAKRNL